MVKSQRGARRAAVSFSDALMREAAVERAASVGAVQWRPCRP